MKVNIKKVSPNAVIPSYAKPGDAGLDLTATNYKYNSTHNYYEYYTGLALEIPDGYMGLIFPRSSISKTDLVLCNGIGVADSKFRGELKLRFFPRSINLKKPNIYKVGDRIGQLIILPYPLIKLNEVEELSETERGAGGFGSSGD